MPVVLAAGLSEQLLDICMLHYSILCQEFFWFGFGFVFLCDMKLLSRVSLNIVIS